MKIQNKYELRDKLILIGIQAIEHALRFLPTDNESRKIIETRLAAVRSGDIKSLGTIKKETTYTLESCLLRASAELVKLTQCQKWMSSQMLTNAVFIPCWDAGIFVGRGSVELNLEQDWQNTNLWPQIKKLYE